jgi:hypothetical protein
MSAGGAPTSHQGEIHNRSITLYTIAAFKRQELEKRSHQDDESMKSSGSTDMQPANSTAEILHRLAYAARAIVRLCDFA